MGLCWLTVSMLRDEVVPSGAVLDWLEDASRTGRSDSGSAPLCALQKRNRIVGDQRLFQVAQRSVCKLARLCLANLGGSNLYCPGLAVSYSPDEALLFLDDM